MFRLAVEPHVILDHSGVVPERESRAVEQVDGFWVYGGSADIFHPLLGCDGTAALDMFFIGLLSHSPG